MNIQEPEMIVALFFKDKVETSSNSDTAQNGSCDAVCGYLFGNISEDLLKTHGVELANIVNRIFADGVTNIFRLHPNGEGFERLAKSECCANLLVDIPGFIRRRSYEKQALLATSQLIKDLVSPAGSPVHINGCEETANSKPVQEGFNS